MNILITGFDAFGNEEINPSYEVIKNLPDKLLGYQLHKHQLSTSFKTSVEQINVLVQKINPEIVIAVGQAGGRSHITIERIAINVQDTTLADNDGNIPNNLPISLNGADGYFSTLPIYKLNEKLQDEGIPAAISNTAGTFVCNTVMYSLLDNAKKMGHPYLSGFIHLPYLPSQVKDKVNAPSMSLELMTRGLQLIIETSIEHKGGQ